MPVLIKARDFFTILSLFIGNKPPRTPIFLSHDLTQFGETYTSYRSVPDDDPHKTYSLANGPIVR